MTLTAADVDVLENTFAARPPAPNAFPRPYYIPPYALVADGPRARAGRHGPRVKQQNIVHCYCMLLESVASRLDSSCTSVQDPLIAHNVEWRG